MTVKGASRTAKVRTVVLVPETPSLVVSICKPKEGSLHSIVMLCLGSDGLPMKWAT